MLSGQSLILKRAFGRFGRPHENAAGASRAAGSASYRRLERASRHYRPSRFALSGRAIRRPRHVREYDQCGLAAAGLWQGRHDRAWLPGGCKFTVERMRKMERRRYRSSACSRREQQNPKSLRPRRIFGWAYSHDDVLGRQVGRVAAGRPNYFIARIGAVQCQKIAFMKMLPANCSKTYGSLDGFLRTSMGAKELNWHVMRSRISLQRWTAHPKWPFI